MSNALEIDQHGETVVGRLSGEIDISQVSVIRDRLLGALDNRFDGLLIDLTAASYIDSAVVNLLFELADRLGTHQLRLLVVVPEGGIVDRVTSIVALASVADVHRSLREALNAIDGGP